MASAVDRGGGLSGSETRPDRAKRDHVDAWRTRSLEPRSARPGWVSLRSTHPYSTHPYSTHPYSTHPYSTHAQSTDALVPFQRCAAGAAAPKKKSSKQQNKSTASKPRTDAPPAPRDVTRYDPKLFGPEVPLAKIVQRLGIPTTAEGRIPNARIVVLKRERRLELFAGDTFLKAYRVQLGRTPAGAKQKVKDGKTPEGEYVICAHKPSRYHRGLWLNYPNAADAARGSEQRLITGEERRQIENALAAGKCPPQTTKLGGYLMFHGQDPTLTNWLARAQRNGQIEKLRGGEPGDGNPKNLEEVWDWTQGCIALLNPDIRELYEVLPNGTPVSILPTGTVTRPGPWPPPPPKAADQAAEAPGQDPAGPGAEPQPARAD